VLEVFGPPLHLAFAKPLFLWLLVLPGLLLVSIFFAILRRRAGIRQVTEGRSMPVVVQYGFAGPFGFWIFVLCAAASGIVALAEPVRHTAMFEPTPADFILLLDGSASMYVADVQPDRWQRAVAFIRTFGESLAWKGDRLALAIFAELAAPQVRLTRDPTAFFFFVDHLGARSPFRLEDDPTWDTNIEEGLSWGLNLVRKDEELFGKTRNPKVFAVISDGQAWSGHVERALRAAREAHAVVHVVGVGTPTGGLIPRPARYDPRNPAPVINATLDRNSLQAIAAAGGGRYFELDTRPDRQIAAQIVASIQTTERPVAANGHDQPLYGGLIVAAITFLAFGTLWLRESVELRLQVVALFGVLVLLGVFVSR
jgi:Ca-activated chloride channel homolog